MADNEHQVPGQRPGPPPAAQPPSPEDPPTPPRGELVVPRTAQPPVPVDPALTKDFQQFQQFQQFQELMRQQKERGFPQGEPPPPGFLQPWGPQPQRRSPIKRALSAIVGKIVTAVIVVLLLVGAGYFAIEYFFGNPAAQLPASEQGGQKQRGAVLFEESPRAAIQAIYDDVAQNDPVAACGRFTQEARDQFVDNFRERGDTCEAIVTSLNSENPTGMKDEYSKPSKLDLVPTTVPTTAVADSVTVSSCALGVRGGPPLGRFTLTRDRESDGGNQWFVTGHESETCAAEPSAPPTS